MLVLVLLVLLIYCFYVCEFVCFSILHHIALSQTAFYAIWLWWAFIVVFKWPQPMQIRTSIIVYFCVRVFVELCDLTVIPMSIGTSRFVFFIRFLLFHTITMVHLLRWSCQFHLLSLFMLKGLGQIYNGNGCKW